MTKFKVKGIPYSHQWHTAAGVTYRGWPFVVLEAVVVYYVQDDNVWRPDLDDLKGIRVPVCKVYRLQTVLSMVPTESLESCKELPGFEGD